MMKTMSASIHIPVLLYHPVNDQPSTTTTQPVVFRAHLQWLAERGWRSLTLAEVEAAVSGRKRAEPRRFLLTYDDGSTDLTNCAEETEVFGFTGIAFLITGRMQQADSGCIATADAQRLAQRGTLEFQSHTHRHVRIGQSTAGREKLVADLSAAQFAAWMTLISSRPGGVLTNYLFGSIRRVRHGMAYW